MSFGKAGEGLGVTTYCGIMRDKKIAILVFDVNETDKERDARRDENRPELARPVVKTCDAPLEDAVSRKTGVCKACRDGWEADNNRFASPEDREKAHVAKMQETAEFGKSQIVVKG